MRVLMEQHDVEVGRQVLPMSRCVRLFNYQLVSDVASTCPPTYWSWANLISN